MKKFYIIIILFVMFAGILIFQTKMSGFPEVVKIVSPDEFYIDYNKNNFPDESELTVLYYARSFKPEQKAEYSAQESAKLSYLAQKYAEKELLNKHPEIVFDEKHRVKTLIVEGNDYAKTLVEEGYALPNDSVENNPYSDINNKIKITNNLHEAAKLKLVSYNKLSNIYHKLDCPHALQGGNITILEEKDVPQSAKKCKLCQKKKEKPVYPRIVNEKYEPLFVNDYIELYATDFTKYFYPSARCSTTVCKSLLYNINKAKESIDFAVYGIYNEPEIVAALRKAKQRGVKIRWVYDLDSRGNSIYSHTKNTVILLSNARSDIESEHANSIMHNKFFIFDGKSVWLGSANISETDLSGFNANTVLLLKSPLIASLYRKEFEQMYSGAFHKNKQISENNENIELGQSTVSVYFSPQDKPIKNRIIPLVQNAKAYIYIPVFVITEKNLVRELKNARSRGVDVRIITDATGAANKYSPVDDMRNSGIKIKIENRAGKMHSKTILIDDEYLIAGSMNLSKSGENYNDENMVVIRDRKIAAVYKKYFLHLWNAIPDKWLYKNPGAESLNSVNSCYDGIDNDYDGKIDAQDEACSERFL